MQARSVLFSALVLSVLVNPGLPAGAEQAGYLLEKKDTSLVHDGIYVLRPNHVDVSRPVQSGIDRSDQLVEGAWVAAATT